MSYDRAIEGALDHVVRWFSQAGLPVERERLLDRAVVFDDIATARRGVAAAFGADESAVPETFGGTVGERTLYLVSEDAYRGTWAKLYADWPWTDRTYEELVIHEIAHRAHELVVLDRFGTSEAMGPVWFFEGLAMTCAAQFVEPGPPAVLTWVAIRDILGPGGSPAVSYPTYARVVRSLVARFPVRVLIERAREAGFPEVLAG